MAQPSPSRAGRRARRAAALALAALVACGTASAARAQSGRKTQKPPPPPPASDSTKQGGPAAAKPEAKRDALVSFVVMRYDDTVFGIDPLARDGVAASFVRRLGQSAAVSVTDVGKGRRQDARARAKEEKTAYVVVFQLDEEVGGMSSTDVDSRTLIIRTYVYTPQTADLKYTDAVYQRPYRDTARVGRVRIPVPTRRVERYPSQQELEQAARDAADRLLSRFQITPPQDR
jgi:hypothetical protein